MRSGRSITKCGRGSTLLIVMIFIIISVIVHMGTLYLKGQQEIVVRAEISSGKAFNLAEAGFERARQWIKRLTTSTNQWPELSQPLIATSNYNPFGGAVTLGAAGETYTTTIRKDLVKSELYRRYYNVRSEGKATYLYKPITAVIKITTDTPAGFLFYVDKLAELPAHN